MLKSKFYKTGAIALVLSLGIGSTAFASTRFNNKSFNGKSVNYKQSEKFKDGFNIKSKFDSLVTSGGIIQAQETAAINALTPSKTQNKPNFTNMFKSKLDSLVTAGTITQDQETAIINGLTLNK